VCVKGSFSIMGKNCHTCGPDQSVYVGVMGHVSVHAQLHQEMRMQHVNRNNLHERVDACEVMPCVSCR
jgi:hypothetical protein